MRICSGVLKLEHRDLPSGVSEAPTFLRPTAPA
jgi:hypothetical protein